MKYKMTALKSAVVVGGGLLGASCYLYFSGSPRFFEHVVMPAARVLDPETAHRAAIRLAARGLIPKDRTKDPDILVRALQHEGTVEPGCPWDHQKWLF